MVICVDDFLIVSAGLLEVRLKYVWQGGYLLGTGNVCKYLKSVVLNLVKFI